MDRLVLEQKLESLRRCVVRVHDKCPATVQGLVDDIDTQDVIVLNLSRAVQLCVDIAMHRLAALDLPPPQTMGEAFEALAQQGIIDDPLATRMRKAVGFRNLAVHNYDAINWAIVFSIASEHLDDFREFAKAFA